MGMKSRESRSLGKTCGGKKEAKKSKKKSRGLPRTASRKRRENMTRHERGKQGNSLGRRSGSQTHKIRETKKKTPILHVKRNRKKKRFKNKKQRVKGGSNPKEGQTRWELIFKRGGKRWEKVLRQKIEQETYVIVKEGRTEKEK